MYICTYCEKNVWTLCYVFNNGALICATCTVSDKTRQCVLDVETEIIDE